MSEHESSGGGAKAALLSLMVLLAAVAVVVADDTTPAAAGELATFSSCEELTGWMSDAQGMASDGGEFDSGFSSTGSAISEDTLAAAPTMATDDSTAERQVGGDGGSAASATGATNVIVEGIDELDRVEQLDDGRILAVGENALHLVDVAAARSVASIPVPPGAQVSYDAERSQIWVVGSDGIHTDVTRLLLDGDTFQVDGSWSQEGMLLTARRSAEGFHAVVVQGFTGPVPFEDGPIACDEVLHPVGPATPEATLIVTLPAEGALEPSAATEIVGAGQFVHLTEDAVFVATALWEATPSTSLHRFDLDTLAHTGSGRVEGSLLNEFSLSLHDGNLRVAVTHGGGRFFIDGGPAVDPAPIDLTVDEPGTEVGGEEQILNEVVVLDTEGDLDVVGRTARFGLPGETLQGIRFVGTTAYAVTFLQTDPFYVIDLATPADPRVVGEVKLPGFSSYLHPVADGYVVGFGPDGDGTVAAKLFDVSDPSAPAVVDTVTLGEDSPVVWDHHAYLALGNGAFAVPATTFEPIDVTGCTEPVRTALQERATALDLQVGQTSDQAQLDALYRELEQIWSDPCLNLSYRPVTTIVELEVAGDSLRVGSRTEVRSEQPGERVLRGDDAWVLYTSLEVVVAPDGAAPVAISLR